MKEIFYIWITVQLIVMGICYVDIYNQVIDKTYICPKDEKIPKLIGALLPLVVFVEDSKEIDNYCNQ